MGALSGIRVVELGSSVGPSYCGKLLAGLGADVVKLEPPEGDALRREGPFPGDEPHPEKTGAFLHLASGKRSVVVDEPCPPDTLLVSTDLLILGHRPSELATAGIDLQALLARHSRLVVANVSTFGLSGPYADYLGGELVAYALGGYMMLTGDPDREPLKAYGNLVEYQAGAHAALGALAALRAREATGRGQFVDVSAMEAATFMLGGVEQSAYFYGRVARRNGTRLMGFPPQHSYPSTIRPCRDGYVHAHSNNRNADLLAALIPDPRLSDPDILSQPFGHADQIDAIMDDWLAAKDRAEIVRTAQELRLPFTEVLTPGEVLADPGFAARDSFVEVAHPKAGRVRQPGAPMRLAASPWVTGPAPTLGQHTAEVLAEVAPVGVAAPPMAGGVARKPLDGIRVIDFTNAVAGPIASFILGDLGADVIKVEGPRARPRVAAGTAPLAEGAPDTSYDRMMTYNELNHGKRGVCLDVTRPEGRDLFLKLAAVSDVVVQNFAPRVMPNLRLDYERLRAVNPAIVLVSMPAFGLDGPYRDRISYGPGLDAMSGLSHLTGYADGPPSKPGNFFCDQQAGALAAFATLAALRHRDLTGEGQHVELPMIEGEFQLLADAYLDFQWNDRERMRSGNDHPRFAPHDAYRCQGEDAWVAIGVESDAQWQALCAVIARRDLVSDPRFTSDITRHENRRLLREPIEAWTSARTTYDAQSTLQSAGVPAGAVLDCLQLLSDPHVVARHGFEYVETPNVGPTPYPRVAFTLSETPVPISKAAPGFAEDNAAVFGDLLRLTQEAIRELERSGITPRAPVGGGQ